MTLFSTGCPKCKVLARKLDEMGAQYNVVGGNDAVDAIMAQGFEEAPILLTDDGRYLTFSESIAFLRGGAV